MKFNSIKGKIIQKIVLIILIHFIIFFVLFAFILSPNAFNVNHFMRIFIGGSIALVLSLIGSLLIKHNKKQFPSYYLHDDKKIFILMTAFALILFLILIAVWVSSWVFDYESYQALHKSFFLVNGVIEGLFIISAVITFIICISLILYKFSYNVEQKNFTLDFLQLENIDVIMKDIGLMMKDNKGQNCLSRSLYSYLQNIVISFINTFSDLMVETIQADNLENLEKVINMLFENVDFIEIDELKSVKISALMMFYIVKKFHDTKKKNCGNVDCISFSMITFEQFENVMYEPVFAFFCSIFLQKEHNLSRNFPCLTNNTVSKILLQSYLSLLKDIIAILISNKEYDAESIQKNNLVGKIYDKCKKRSMLQICGLYIKESRLNYVKNNIKVCIEECNKILSVSTNADAMVNEIFTSEKLYDFNRMTKIKIVKDIFIAHVIAMDVFCLPEWAHSKDEPISDLDVAHDISGLHIASISQDCFVK